MKTLKIILAIALLFVGQQGLAQLQQTVRGTVVDQDSKAALDGVTVVVTAQGQNFGAISNEDGAFTITDIPVGRVDIRITYVGFETRYLPNQLLSSGKELVLNIEMQESFASLKDAVVTGTKKKNRVINEMAIVSSRSFSVEETKRYAGAIDDPARMVSAYAGVNIDAEGNNDIIVRGNSSKGILWRLEGMEIPNPNHFANDGSTGGPINALNSNMLGNSDFLTGAFSPEYGNAVSGVFDMRLRNGNNSKREYTATASVLGLDMAAEGPFKQGYSGSYLINYRYSTLDLLDRTGVVDFGGVPRYQDLSFKVNLPLGEKHKISAYGLGGLSSISQLVESEDPEEPEHVLFKGEFYTNLGVLGASHLYQLNSKAYVKTQFQLSTTGNRGDAFIPDSNQRLYEVARDNYIQNSFKVASTFNVKLNANNKLKSGFILNRQGYDLTAKYWSFESNQLENLLAQEGSAYVVQGFSSWQHRFSQELTFVGGLHYLHSFLTESSNLEPRAAIAWDMNKRHSFNAGMGIHSKLESLSLYMAQERQDDGSFVRNNSDLDLMKAAHFVIGHRYQITTKTSFKYELFYQHLYDVPIDTRTGSNSSLLNRTASFTTTPLDNEGTGRNYGLELTAERVLSDGYYFLSTLSLYKSQYTAADGIERESKFSGGHVFNLLFGKEFAVGNPSKNRILFVNAKTAWIGGSRYTPIDLAASIELGDEVLHEDRPYATKGDDILKIDLAIGMRRNKKKYNTEWKIDVQNVTNNQAVVDEYYIHGNQSIEKAVQLGLFPVLSYKWQF